MSDPSRKAERKRKYRPDGTPVWSNSIEGPGVWVSCIKGKEKQCAGEVCDLFEALAKELWPESLTGTGNKEESTQGDLDIEAQIAKEMAFMKQPPKGTQRFKNCLTNTPCVVFISCKPPTDPVRLVLEHVESVKKTGITQTRHTHRLVPVSGSCTANIPEILALCHRLVLPALSDAFESTSYKIELRIRNHNSIPRPTLLQEIARCIPEVYKVDLENPSVFVLVEVFKNTCGISVVKNYYSLQKFNVKEIAKGVNQWNGEERIRIVQPA